jgi:GNAT superfamily N-acetyltransferase
MNVKNNIKIRQATVDDIDAIYHVRTSVKENHLSEEALITFGITREATRQAIINSAFPIWCAFVENQLVGFSSAKEEDNELESLFVLPEFEGRGIGSALYEVAIKWLGDKNPHQPLSLNTEKAARAFLFYQRRGWVVVEGEPKAHMNDGDVFMQLRADPK